MVHWRNYKFFLLLADMLALVASGLIGLYLRFEGAPPTSLYLEWSRFMLIAVPLFAVVYYYFGLYRQVWRYASAPELVTIAGAVTLAMGTLLAVLHLDPARGFPRSVLVIAWLFNVALVGGWRFALRLVAGRQRGAKGHQGPPTLVLGAGDAARILIDETRKHPELGTLVGFLDDDPHKAGLLLGNVPVLGPLSMIDRLVKEQGISQIIIAMPSATKALVKGLVEKSANLGIKAQIMPGIYQVLGTDSYQSPVREVRIEDLLGRGEKTADCAMISGYVRGKKVLVTGAGGSIGSELCRQLARCAPAELLLLGRGENSIYEIHRELAQVNPDLNIIPLIADVQDARRIESIFAHHTPQVIFHAAAHKHVPLMEQNPTEAVKNNFFGTRNVVNAVLANKSEIFVLVSTDKAVNPVNVMGATKRMAELLVQSHNQMGKTKLMAVRFGNVLGSRGSVIPLFKEQISRGGPVTVTHPDMTRYFMTISEAVSLIIEAGSMGQGGEVFVLDMGEPVKIVELAKTLITLSGLRPEHDIPIVFSGLRPGEKLYEELLTAHEVTAATSHERIRIARQSVLGRTQWQAAFTRAEQMGKSCTRAEVLNLLQSIEELAVEQVASAGAEGQ
ncbi:MAG: UDP-N-acetyl-alpha-D-glucosamine C6 dehydratase [Firmicutes bacterium]|nr:UDP-N-acetyl-alpha-D-glucosamine C6 dehydratase [Bacillota bacterium]